MNTRLLSALLIAAAASACGATTSELDSDSTGGPVGAPPAVSESRCDWSQALGTSDHVGRACQPLHGLHVVAVLPQAPDAAEVNRTAGFLQDNLGSVVTSGDFVAVPMHHGGDQFNRANDTWSVDLWRWNPSVTAAGAKLEHVAEVPSSWKAVDSVVGSGPTNLYVQMFGAAFRGGILYVPQAAGRIQRVNPATGAALATIDPFAGGAFSGDARLIGSGGITVAPTGAIYYTAMAWPAAGAPRGSDPRGSWLVRIGTDNSSRIATWLSLTPASLGVPQRNDGCNWPFGTLGGGDATGPDSAPPVAGCGFQKPVINVAPTIRPTDGHVILHSVGNNNIWSEWIVEADPVTLAPIRAIPLRERMHQGCGVRIPLVSDEFGDECDVITAHGTTHLGFDPEFNLPVSLRAGDIDSNQPFCLSNGDCGTGGYDGGFAFGGNYDARGALLLFDPAGNLAATNEEFGWDVTPSAWVHDGVTTLVQDRDLFSDLDLQVGRYSATFELQAKSSVPIDFDALAVEWIDVNTPVDVDGHSYGVNANGHLYQFGPDGQASEVLALIDPATGAPVAMDGLAGFLARDGASRVYAPIGGRVYVVEGGAAQNDQRIAPSMPRALTAALRASAAAKAAARANVPTPVPPQ